MSTRDFIEKDYYAALGVAKDASSADIKRAYRKLARELHPDKNPGDAKAEAKFKEVSEAYDVLSNDQRRKEYDEARSLFAGAGAGGGFPSGFGGFGGGTAGPGGPTTFDLGDLFGRAGAGAGPGAAPNAGDGGFGGGLGDLFGGLFGGQGGGRRSRPSGPVRGQDVETQVSLDFEDAVRGSTLPLRLTSPGPCPTCHGSGARPGTSPRTCPVCGGTGATTRNQGAFAFSEPCRECRGTGRLIDDPCPDCAGSGTATQTRTINVRIPAGVRDGQRIRVAGKGAPSPSGGVSGDLFVSVRVKPHDLFGRNGNDLTLTVPISFPEAALGTTLSVPTLDGSVRLKVPAGTSSGRTFRVRGRGVATAKSTGDLLVTVEVAVPQNLSESARSALEDFAKAQPQDPRPDITGRLK